MSSSAAGKQRMQSEIPGDRPPFSSRSYWKLALFLATGVCLITLHWISSIGDIYGNASTFQDEATSFHWDEIRPSVDLQYHTCFDGYECARLQVPVDWNRTDTDQGDQVAIAIIKRPARVSIADPRYGGAIILINGGPGGSGVQLILQYGKSFQTIVDADMTASPGSGGRLSSEGKYFDLIGFDPRGVNNTTPGFLCFASRLSHQAWNIQTQTTGFSIHDSEATFQRVWAENRAVGLSCSGLNATIPALSVNGNEHLGQYISTASVVRDMVEIVERHGQWRERTVEKLLSEKLLSEKLLSEKLLSEKLLSEKPDLINVESIRKDTAWHKGEEKLLCWGFSYGTFVGESFASMQPHRVGRMVLDGVVDPNFYIRWEYSRDLQDIDHITEIFTVNCYQAGPEHCAVYRGEGPTAIQTYLEEVLQNIKDRPLAISTEHGPLVITHSDVVMAMFRSYYGPFSNFAPMAQMVYDLSHGNITSFAASLGHLSCSSSSNSFEIEPYSAFLGVTCADGEDQQGLTQAAFRNQLSEVRRQSLWFGDKFAAFVLTCLGYSIRSKWRFTGPFGGETAHPILFASQSSDPVTPLEYAFRASKLFPGSTVLETLGYGHCTMALPSLCTAKHIRRYFHTGHLPPRGEQCEVDVEPFGLHRNASLDAGDQELLEALIEVAQTWPRML